MMSKRVLGEASRQEGSLEAGIKAKATFSTDINKKWIPLDDVLVLVQKDREEHNKELRNFIQNLDDAMASDLHGRIFDYNKDGVKILEYAKKELLKP